MWWVGCQHLWVCWVLLVLDKIRVQTCGDSFSLSCGSGEFKFVNGKELGIAWLQWQLHFLWFHPEGAPGAPGMLGLQVETLMPFCVTGQSWSQVSGLILCVFSKLDKNEPWNVWWHWECDRNWCIKCNSMINLHKELYKNCVFVITGWNSALIYKNNAFCYLEEKKAVSKTYNLWKQPICC